MMTREQEAFVELRAAEHGRVQVRDGFADGHVNVTVQGGRSWEVPEDASPSQIRETVNHSVDWDIA